MLFILGMLHKKNKFVDVQGQNLSEKYNIERDQIQSQKSHVLNIYQSSVVESNSGDPSLAKSEKSSHTQNAK